MRELSTQGKIIVKRLYDPYATLQSIGDSVNTTREYVRQVLKKHRLPTRHVMTKEQRSRLFCPKCGRPKNPQAKLCAKCYHNEIWTTIACDECAIEFPIRVKDLKYRREVRGYKHIWCSKKCHGAWFAKNYGWVKGKKSK